MTATATTLDFYIGLLDAISSFLKGLSTLLQRISDFLGEQRV